MYPELLNRRCQPSLVYIDQEWCMLGIRIESCLAVATMASLTTKCKRFWLILFESLMVYG